MNLDYVIEKYVVEYFRKNGISSTVVSFGTEEEAIDFIKDRRRRWSEYRLIKIQHAVIDF